MRRFQSITRSLQATGTAGFVCLLSICVTLFAMFTADSWATKGMALCGLALIAALTIIDLRQK
jgi:hypothetical protein